MLSKALANQNSRFTDYSSTLVTGYALIKMRTFKRMLRLFILCPNSFFYRSCVNHCYYWMCACVVCVNVCVHGCGHTHVLGRVWSQKITVRIYFFLFHVGSGNWSQVIRPANKCPNTDLSPQPLVTNSVSRQLFLLHMSAQNTSICIKNELQFSVTRFREHREDTQWQYCVRRGWATYKWPILCELNSV